MANEGEEEGRWKERLWSAAPHVVTIISVAFGVAWWGGKMEQRIIALEREQEREQIRQAAFKADVQRELSTIGTTVQSVDNKVTTLLITMRANGR